MPVDYAVKYNLQNLVDERFATESKTQPLINNNFEFAGVKTVRIYDVNTVAIGNYTRTGASRYGTPAELDAVQTEYTLTQDKAFTFTIDKMNADESMNALAAGDALSRQIRERVVPHIDTYRFTAMAAATGILKPTAAAITSATIYNQLLDATVALDDNEVPTENRYIVCTPATYKLFKQAPELNVASNVTSEQRKRGVMGMIDGMEVIVVPSNRLTVTKFGFMVAHPIATTSPVKLAEYKIHQDPPGISGSLVEGRLYFDCFVRKNKAKGIYLHLLP